MLALAALPFSPEDSSYFLLQDYGEVDGKRIQQLGLCPKSPNCISTSEAANSRNAVGGADHYVPPW